MISVASALNQLFRLICLMETEHVRLDQASSRILSRQVIAKRNQPPFDSSSMDGYAVSDLRPKYNDQYKVVGEAAAGKRFSKTVARGQAVRVFTGAPIPVGTKTIIIQEDIVIKKNTIIVSKTIENKTFIRRCGCDFQKGFSVKAPRLLRSADIALLASMNISLVPVFRKPKIAIIATGDELVMPGEKPKPDQIISSNNYGLASLIKENGGNPHIFPVAKDKIDSLTTTFEMAQDADLIITIGGASVGDYDYVMKAAKHFGFKKVFYKIAMRPGKPMMAGLLGNTPMLGLPGNPVSAMVCGQIFLLPLLNSMLGLAQKARDRVIGKMGQELQPNGGREHYMRASLIEGFLYLPNSQDSSLLTTLSESNALIVRPPNSPAAKPNELVPYIPL